MKIIIITAYNYGTNELHIVEISKAANGSEIQMVVNKNCNLIIN